MAAGAGMEPAFTARGLRVHLPTLRSQLGTKWQSFLNRLTVRERPQPGAPPAALSSLRRHQCYQVEGEYLLLPRRYGALLQKFGFAAGLQEPPGTFGGQPSEIRRLPAARCQLAVALYDYQQAYVEHVLVERLGAERRRAGDAQVYVEVGTGKGKTFMALAVGAGLRVPMCFIVPTRALQADGVREANLALPELTAVAYSNELERRCRKRGEPPPSAANTDIMFCVVNTAREKPPSFFRGFGLIVLDEAHEYHSPKSSALLWNAAAPCTVGLSATPLERPDGMDRVVVQHLGPPLPLEAVVDAELIGDIDFDGRVREVWYSGHPDYLPGAVLADGTIVPATGPAICKIGRLIDDPHRLALVAAEVDRILHLHETLPPAELEEWGLGPYPGTGELRRHSVFVFAEHRRYLPAFRAALVQRLGDEFIYCPDLAEEAEEQAAAAHPVMLRGGASDEERAAARQCRVVVTTYGFSRRGISLPHMTALVKATPRRHGSTQIDGRICRRANSPALCSIRRLVVDLRDVETALASQSTQRRQRYADRDWPIFYLKQTYTDYPLGQQTAAPLHTAEKPVRRRGAAEEEEAAADAASFDLAAEVQKLWSAAP